MGQTRIYEQVLSRTRKAVRKAAGIAVGCRVVVKARDDEAGLRRPVGVLEFSTPEQRTATLSLPDTRRAAREEGAQRQGKPVHRVIVDTDFLLCTLDRGTGARTKATRERVEAARASGETFTVLSATVLEMAYVLESSRAGYGWNRDVVARAIQAVTAEPAFDVEHSPALRQAATHYRTRATNLHACFLGALADERRARVLSSEPAVLGADHRRGKLSFADSDEEQGRAEHITLKRLARQAPIAMIALGGALIVWALAVQLTLGLHDDEIHTFNLYVSSGPGAIWGRYIANDHMLYELLTWMLSTIVGHGDPVLRIWGLLPAIASVALLAWWLWRRLSPWAAAMFVALIAASPVFVFLSAEARGYGLCFLAAALTLVGADSYVRNRQRHWLAMFAIGAIVGIWAIPVFVLPVTVLAVLLLWDSRRTPRRDLVTSFALIGLLCAAFYLPVLNDLITTSGQRFGRPLSGAGSLSGPPSYQLQPTLTTIVPGMTGRPTNAIDSGIEANYIIDESATTLTPAIRAALIAQTPSVTVELIAAVSLLLGMIMLVSHGEGFLAAALLVPTIFSYLTLEIAGSYFASRFLSFLLAPLLILCVAGVVLAARRLVGRPAPPVVALCATAACAFLLLRAEGLTSIAAQELDGYNTAASIVTKTRIPTILTNRGWGVGHYLSRPLPTESPPQLAALFCHRPAPFVYVEDGLFPRATPSTACLSARHAQRIPVPNRRQIPRAVWIVTR